MILFWVVWNWGLAFGLFLSRELKESEIIRSNTSDEHELPLNTVLTTTNLSSRSQHQTKNEIGKRLHSNASRNSQYTIVSCVLMRFYNLRFSGSMCENALFVRTRARICICCNEIAAAAIDTARDYEISTVQRLVTFYRHHFAVVWWSGDAIIAYCIDYRPLRICFSFRHRTEHARRIFSKSGSSTSPIARDDWSTRSVTTKIKCIFMFSLREIYEKRFIDASIPF